MSNERVVNAALAGGINQEVDQFLVKPPEMLTLENASVVKPGRLEKRNGFDLVVSTPGTPATAFDGDTVPSPFVEAMSPYYGADGDRMLLASGNTLYEHVGSDSTHGWRTVNKLPSYLGTVHPVASTGGSIIEVDSLESSDGAYRLTVWVSGQRTGQETTNDTWYGAQEAGPGNAVYYAVQYVSTGALVKPPTLLKMSESGKAIYNLRLVKLFTSSSVYAAGIAYQTGLGYSLNFHVANFATGSVTAAAYFGTGTHACYRTFDITGLPYSVTGGPAVVWAHDAADTGSNSTYARMYAEMNSVNVVTGALTFIDSRPDIIAHSTTLYNPWAHRGVVLEQDPTSGTISFAARVLSRYYYPPGTATTKLDGQIVLGRLTLTATTLSVAANQVYVPYLGLQTADNTSGVLAVTANPGHYSGQPTDISEGVLDIRTTTPYPLVSTGGTITPMVVTMNLADGSTQMYITQTGETSEFGSYPTFTKQRTISSAQPYFATEAQQIQLSGVFPRPVHYYPRNEKMAAVYTNRDQVTQIDLTSAVSNTGFTPGPHAGCSVKVGATTICTACVYVNGSGAITEIAIENGNPGYAFTDSVTPVDITSLTGAGPGTLNKAHAYGNLHNAFRDLAFNDVPDTAATSTNTSYAQSLGYEMCVHRWSVASAGGYTALALSSTSANTFTTPNGDEPYGAAVPHAQNNFFEVYKWDGSTSGSLVGTTSTPCLVAALGGPWRLLSSLHAIGTELLCAVSPAGDDYQRNTFLLRVGDISQSVGITFPTLVDSLGSSSFTYQDNPGVFVESANMMRATSMPMNVPSLRSATGGIGSGALRDGSANGTQEVMFLSYDNDSASWRQMCRLSDYTYVNGGLLSVFDGVGCGEAATLLWPQCDLTSINWPKTPDIYVVTAQGSANYSSSTFQANAFFGGASGNAGRGGFFLVNITRPYFAYEAGFNDINGYQNPLGNGWGSPIETRWGGDPKKDYQSVYADVRSTQISVVGRASYAYSATAANDIHYYGRYQSYSSGLSGTTPSVSYSVGDPTRGGCSKWVWAPRAAGTWGVTANNEYKAEEAGGDFLMRWTYESADGTGRILRSAPSNAVTYTVCAEIVGAYYDPNSSSQYNSIAYSGGLVTQFRYGFFAPTLELTNRLKTAEVDARRVALQPYTTAEPYSTVLYKMPFSSFLNPFNDFVIGRNQGRGIVQYNSSPFSGSNPLGYVCTNFQVFDGPMKDYNGVMAEPYLYTTGNVLDNVAPPSCKAMCVHQNRLVIGGADDASVIWFSKELNPTDAPGFNDELTMNISEGGPVTGLASLGDSLVVFKKNDVFIVSGTFPDSTGVSTSLGTPYALPSGLGCVDHRSVIETPLGVFFRSTRSIELLKPNFEIFQIGDKVQNYLNSDEQILSVAHNAKAQEVYFTMGQGKILVYSYKLNGWYTWTAPDVSSLSSPRAAVLGNTLWYSVPSDDAWNVSNPAQAFTYKQNSLYVDQLRGTGSYTPAFYALNWTMGPFTMNEQQGHQRVKRIRIFSWVDGPATIGLPGAQILIGTDGGINGINDLVQTVTFTESQVKSIQTSQGFIQLETHCANQKGQLQLVGFTETAPAVVDDQCRNLFMSNIAVVVGLKTGLNKRITEQAKH